MTALTDDHVVEAVRKCGPGGVHVDDLAALLRQPDARYLGQHLARLWRKGKVFYGKDEKWRTKRWT